MRKSNFKSAADRAAVQNEAPWSEVAKTLEPTVYGMLARTSAKFPDRPAISFQIESGAQAAAETLNWAELQARVTQAANLFRRHGITEDDVVALILPNSNEAAVAILGGMTAGIVAPINPLLEPATIASILRELDAKLVVTLKSMPKTDLAQKVSAALEHAPSVRVVLEVDLNRYLRPPKSWIVPFIRPRNPAHHRAKVLDFHAEAAREQPKALSFELRTDDRVAACYHTGGTTGLPKVARHRYSGMIYNAWLGKRLLFDEEDVLMCPLPLFHVFATYAVLLNMLSTGAHGIFPTPQGYRGEGVFDNFWKLVERWGVTFMLTVPTAIAAHMQRPVDAATSSIRTGISGSAPMPKTLFKRFEKATGLKISEGYGLTEATCLVSCNPVEGEVKIGSVGLPFPHTEVEIRQFDKDGTITRECSTEEVGEICISSPGVMQGGVYATPELNEKLYTQDGFLRTGDLGKIDTDGFLWITGRSKDIIIRGGNNIDPAPIEEAILSHDAVAFAGVVGQPDAYAGELPCAYVELVAGAKVTESELLKHLKGRIPERASIPKHMEILPEIPKTAVGKIFKPDLRRLAICRVLDSALAEAGVAAEVAEVREERARGLVARIRRKGALDQDRAEEVLGEFPTRWEWLD